ncbi:MAG: hypothetical protein RLY93_19350 [Sumerlaeia bacterium]
MSRFVSQFSAVALAAGLTAPAIAQKDVAEKDVTLTNVPLSQWDITPETNPVTGFARGRVSFNQDQTEIIFQPNATTPGNTFAFISSPVLDAPPMVEPDKPGTMAVGMRLLYEADAVAQGQFAPFIRLRAGLGDNLGTAPVFDTFAESQATQNRIGAGGSGQLVVLVDQSQLINGTDGDIRYFIDFIAFGEPVDPNYTVRIVGTDLLEIEAGDIVNSDSSVIRAAYVDDDRLYVHVNDLSDNRIEVVSGSDVDDYAYRGRFLVVINDDGELFGYDAAVGFNSGDRFDIEVDSGDEVVGAAISGNFVSYVEEGGRTRVFNLDSKTQTATIIDQDTPDISPDEVFGITAGGVPGSFILVLEDNENDIGERDLFAFDANNLGAGVPPIASDVELDYIRTLTTNNSRNANDIGFLKGATQDSTVFAAYVADDVLYVHLDAPTSTRNDIAEADELTDYVYNGAFIAIVDNDGALGFYDATEGFADSDFTEIEPDGGVLAVAIGQDYLVYTDDDNRARLVNLATFPQTPAGSSTNRPVLISSDDLYGIGVGGDGSTFLVFTDEGSGDVGIQAYDAETGDPANPSLVTLTDSADLNLVRYNTTGASYNARGSFFR